ncbi:MAG: MBL fold metallo-hydrolase [Syntrophales bacterium]
MFNARLVNDPFGDPGVYIEILFRKEALLFDLGDVRPLAPRKLLKVDHVFVSHTHMDHFIGFDHLLRVCLGRDKELALYGPPGFIKNVESKIGAYTWNLVENYTNDFVIRATEIDGTHRVTRVYRCQRAFRPEIAEGTEAFDGVLVDHDLFTVRGVFLDHRIPCLAYCLEEKKRINIKKNGLEEMGLPIGPWLMELKDKVLRDEPDSTPVEVWRREKGKRVADETYPLGILKEKLVKVTPGHRISYIADAQYNPVNISRILEIAGNSDHMFIEACFLDADAERAREKYHLTARQAGELAGMAGAKRITLFHFSPKYQGKGELLVQEAMGAFESKTDR